MENESLGMAMAKLAKLAKPIPPKKSFPPSGYGESGENGEKAKSPRQGNPVFRQNSQNSRSHLGEINFSTRPRVTVDQLPERLVTAATRVCRELWNDDDEAVRTMMEALTLHFEAQLPPPPPRVIPALVTCSGCSHAEYRTHPAIGHCKAGIDSGNATGGMWATDPHPCEKYQDRTGKPTAEDAHQGAN